MTRLALAAVAALALAVAGCGSSDPTRATVGMDAKGSFAYESTQRDPFWGTDESCTGAVNAARSRIRMTCTGTVKSETVVVGETGYFRFPESSGSTWGSIALAADWQIRKVAPERMLLLLRSASESTRRVGKAKVRGVPTVRHALVVDCQDAVVLTCDLRDSTPVDVWIDRGGMLRRMRYDEDEITHTIEFYDFGVPVRIVTPPPTEVVPAPFDPNFGGPGGGVETLPSSP